MVLSAALRDRELATFTTISGGSTATRVQAYVVDASGDPITTSNRLPVDTELTLSGTVIVDQVRLGSGGNTFGVLASGGNSIGAIDINAPSTIGSIAIQSVIGSVAITTDPVPVTITNESGTDLISGTRLNVEPINKQGQDISMVHREYQVLILDELKKINAHLEIINGEKIKEEDIK